jgi:hypothetical protein
MLALLPLLAALLLAATLLGATHHLAFSPFRLGPNLPRAYFGLPPRRPPRLLLFLALLPCAVVALVCGWVVVPDGGPRERQAILLAVSTVVVPSALAALGVWFLHRRVALPTTPLVSTFRANYSTSRLAATLATALLPPLAAGLCAGYTSSPAGPVVFATVATLVAVATALAAAKRAPSSPFEDQKRSSCECCLPHVWIFALCSRACFHVFMHICHGSERSRSIYILTRRGSSASWLLQW